MPSKAVDQLALDETVIDNAEAESALEARYSAKNRKAAITKEFKSRDEEAKGLVGALVPEGTEGAVRIGRFRITRTERAPHVVKSFEVSAASLISIDDPEDSK